MVPGFYMKISNYAKIAYLAYGSVTDFKNFRGEPMPQYDDLPDIIKKAWEAAAQKVLDLSIL